MVNQPDATGPNGPMFFFAKWQKNQRKSIKASVADFSGDPGQKEAGQLAWMA